MAVTILDDGIEKDHPDLIRNYDPLASETFLQFLQIFSFFLHFLHFFRPLQILMTTIAIHSLATISQTQIAMEHDVQGK